MATAVLASIGDNGALNASLTRWLAGCVAGGGHTGASRKLEAAFVGGYEYLLRDQRQAWVLEPDGKYVQLRAAPDATGPEAGGTHKTLMDLALARAQV